MKIYNYDKSKVLYIPKRSTNPLLIKIYYDAYGDARKVTLKINDELFLSMFISAVNLDEKVKILKENVERLLDKIMFHHDIDADYVQIDSDGNFVYMGTKCRHEEGEK